MSEDVILKHFKEGHERHWYRKGARDALERAIKWVKEAQRSPDGNVIVSLENLLFQYSDAPCPYCGELASHCTCEKQK